MVALKRLRVLTMTHSGNRSRNAVVALKHPAAPRPHAHPAGSRNAVVALKRYFLDPPESANPPEAGTPWWH